MVIVLWSNVNVYQAVTDLKKKKQLLLVESFEQDVLF